MRHQVIELLCRDEAETLAVGRALAAVVRGGEVVAIDGPLGAGKTRLVRGLALGMGFEGTVVSSPTYVVVNEYVLGDEIRLFHVDAYRLTGPADLDSLGWERVMDGSAVVAIEWAERVSSALGTEQGVWRVRMETVGDATQPEQTVRRIEVVPPTGSLWAQRDGAEELRRVAAVLTGDGQRPVSGGALPRGWVRCAITGKAVPPDSPTFPFADERSRLADLGRWMSGAYMLSRELTEEDEGEIGDGSGGGSGTRPSRPLN